MGELTIRRNRGFAVVPRQETGKAEKAAPAGQSRPAARPSSPAETSGALTAGGGVRAGRRALQTGEAALAEVQDRLGRMEELARRAAGGEAPDREALQEELEQLAAEIERIASGEAPPASGETPGGAEALPGWLTAVLGQPTLTPEGLLAALGLDSGAGAAEIMAAISGTTLEGSAAAGYLAALYLGAVISGSDLSGPIDLPEALGGLRQLLEKVAGGTPPDEALAQLTDGAFTSLADFESQFTGGTAPSLRDFLVNLLLSGEGPALPAAPLPALLAGLEGAGLELLLGLFTGAQSAQGGESAALSPAASGGGDAAPGAPETAETGPAAAPAALLQFGGLQAEGRDLSGLTFNAGTGELTVEGSAPVTLRGAGQAPLAVLVTGSGPVTLQNAVLSTLTVAAPDAQIRTAGESALETLALGRGAVLTLGGGGLLTLGAVRAEGDAALRLTGGAVVLAAREDGGALPVPVVLEGPVSLAAQAASVRSPAGETLKPFDLVWKALLPGWSAVTSLTVDGRQAKALLPGGGEPAPARLWLTRGDQGFPAHTLVLRGRDASGRPSTQYAYLYWNQRSGTFEERSLYPNPFTVTGGEPEVDWVYEEGSQTLRILSAQVTAVSGGAGMDANQVPFSGRIALADGLGPAALTLGGVVCRVGAGRALDLGRDNDVTLVLQSGSSSCFESGRGCAGISLGEGTSLCIDCTSQGGRPSGVLTASGGEGSPAIGRDGGRPLSGRILLRGASGPLPQGLAGTVTIAGGVVTAAGGKTAGGKTGGGPAGEPSWTGAVIALQLGEDTAVLPRLSGGELGLGGLSVSTRLHARAAVITIAASRRRVSLMQAAYGGVYGQLEQDRFSLFRRHAGRQQGPVRDVEAADTLLQDMRQTLLGQSALAANTHSGQGTEDVGQLLR